MLPDRVYQEFERIIGSLPGQNSVDKETMTVFTYDLGISVPSGQHRQLSLTRTLRFLLRDFSGQFVAGKNLPSGETLDNKIKYALGLK
ncbi:MAG: hypothetical protein OHK0015_35510 [Chloroflexi bacterium OHK40]